MSITKQGSRPENENGSGSSANEEMRRPSQVNNKNHQQQQLKGEAWKKFQNARIDSSSHSDPPRLPGRTRTQTDIKSLLAANRSNSNSSFSSADGMEDAEQQQQQPRVTNDEDVVFGTPQQSHVDGGDRNNIVSMQSLKDDRKTQEPKLPGRQVTPKVTVRPVVDIQDGSLGEPRMPHHDDRDVAVAQVTHEDENDEHAYPPEGERRKSEPPKLPGRRPSKSSTPSTATMEKVYEDFRDKFARRFSVPKLLPNGVRISQAPKIPGRRPSHQRRSPQAETLDEGMEQNMAEAIDEAVVTSKWSDEYDDSSLGTFDGGEFDEEDHQQSSLIRQWVANLEDNPSDDEEEEDDDDDEEVVLFDLDKSVEESFNSSFHLYLRQDSIGSNISTLSMGTTKFESEIAGASASTSSSGRKQTFGKKGGHKRFSNSMKGSGEKRVGKPNMPRRQRSTGHTYISLSEASSTKDTSASEKDDSKEEEDIREAAPTTASTECPPIHPPQIPIRQLSLAR